MTSVCFLLNVTYLHCDSHVGRLFFLAGLLSEMITSVDPETKKENEELKSKLTALQQQLVVIMREKSELKEKVFKLEDEIDAKEQTAGAGNSEREKELETKIDVLQDAVENSKMKIQRLEAELVAAKVPKQ